MQTDTLKDLLATIAEKPIKVINADKWSLDAPGNAGWKWIGFRKDKPVACVIDDASRGYFKDEMLDAYADLFAGAPQLAAEVIRLREEVVQIASGIRKLDDTVADALRVKSENERLREALSFYVKHENWCIDGPLDGNSPQFTGGPAKETLAALTSKSEAI